jgi:hypothetical protein
MGSQFSVLSSQFSVLSSQRGERRAAPLEWKPRRVERHLDEHAISVRAWDDGSARRDLQGLRDFEEKQDRQDQKGWEAVAPKVWIA